MAPLPRPILRFAVGTTLLAPVAATAACDERPPVVNTAAPDPVAQPPAGAEGASAAPAQEEPADEVDPSAGDPPGASGAPGTPESTPLADPDAERAPMLDVNVNTRPDGSDGPGEVRPAKEKRKRPPRVNTNRPDPEPAQMKEAPRVNTPKPEPELK